MLEGTNVIQIETKEVKQEYFRRVKLVAKLNDGNLIRAIGVVRYSAGILDCSDCELRTMDVKMRKR